jgi:hypothetical protein
MNCSTDINFILLPFHIYIYEYTLEIINFTTDPTICYDLYTQIHRYAGIAQRFDLKVVNQ